MAKIVWTKWPWQQCKGVGRQVIMLTPLNSEPMVLHSIYYRCERVRNHLGDCMAERGMDTPTWITKWTG